MKQPSRLVSEPLQTERLPNGYRKLLRDLVIDVGEGYEITVPADTRTDFSSIPWFARFFVRWSKVDIAGVVHDYLYQTGAVSRFEADRIWGRVAVSGEHHANAFQGWGGTVGLYCVGWIAWREYRKEKSLWEEIRHGSATAVKSIADLFHHTSNVNRG